MFERVKEIIEEQLNLDGVEITEASRFKEDLQAAMRTKLQQIPLLRTTWELILWICLSL